MISAIVDGVLLLALVVTTIRMVQMHKELRRVSSYHADYQRIFDQTALALDGVEVSIQEINVKGAQILNALGGRMDDARDLIAEIDGLTREAKRQQSVLRGELKQLSEAMARFQEPHRFKPAQDDLERFAQEFAETGAAKKDRGPSPVSNPALRRGDTHTAATPRIHKIDNTLGSPFRAVSMNQKD